MERGAQSTVNMPDIDVLVLGAGMAGLAAARALGEHGLRVMVVEGRDRVGGRVLSVRDASGTMVELGAEFVHGRAPELWALIEECGAKTVERSGAMLHEKEPGVLLNDDGEDGMDDDPFASLSTLADLPVDTPFETWLTNSDRPDWQRPMLRGYVEGFNAADATVISAQSVGVQQRAEEASGGGRSWHVVGGYAQLADCLAERVRKLGGHILLSSPVRILRWSPGAVAVELASGEVVQAARCIVTLPLGVLQNANRAGGVRMEPAPAALTHAHRMVMGQAERFTMLFRSRWWKHAASPSESDLERMSFLFTPARTPPVWWTAHTTLGRETEALASLTGWAGGPNAGALQGRTAAELSAEACRSLAEVFGLPERRVREELSASYKHDWFADPFARGAYSYVAAGALDSPGAMAQPEADTLFFAGEHTDTSGHWGTVHAALRTGLRAARQVLGEVG